MFTAQLLSSQKMPITDALLLSLLGFAVVFCVLILLIVVIKVLTTILRPAARTVPAGAPDPVEAVAVREAARIQSTAGKVPAPGSVGECNLHSVDDKTAALLMAIVADDLKAPLNELRFISIREI